MENSEGYFPLKLEAGYNSSFYLHSVYVLYIFNKVSRNFNGTDFSAGRVQLWIYSADPPGEHRYENSNNKKKF